MFEFIFTCFITSAILFARSRKKDIEGCTDASSLSFNPDADADADADAIAFGHINSITFEFEADGDFEWSGIPNSGSTFFGSGDWQIDGDFLEIEFG